MTELWHACVLYNMYKPMQEPSQEHVCRCLLFPSCWRPTRYSWVTDKLVQSDTSHFRDVKMLLFFAICLLLHLRCLNKLHYQCVKDVTTQRCPTHPSLVHIGIATVAIDSEAKSLPSWATTIEWHSNNDSVTLPNNKQASSITHSVMQQPSPHNPSFVSCCPKWVSYGLEATCSNACMSFNTRQPLWYGVRYQPATPWRTYTPVLQVCVQG